MVASTDARRMAVNWVDQFPAELWSAEVIRGLDPMDVLSLSQVRRHCAPPMNVQTDSSSQTCQTLRSILSRLTIWRRIFLSVCDTYGLFLPSYPIEEMDVAELQSAALRPYLWQHLVRNKAVPVQDLDEAVPLPAKESSGELWAHWLSLELVPGGRYLLMINSSPGLSKRELELWDLGLPGKRPQPEPILLANTNVDPYSDYYDLFVCPRGDYLVIAASYMVEGAQMCVP